MQNVKTKKPGICTRYKGKFVIYKIGTQMTGPDPDTLPGFPGWSRLVKSHCTIPKEDTMELHFKEGSKHMH